MPAPHICRITTVSWPLRTQLRAQMQHAAAAGFDVTLVCSPDDDLVALGRELGVRTQGVPMARRTSPARDLASLAALTRFFARERFDLVHSSTPKAGLLSVLAGVVSRTPLRLHTFTGQPWVELRGASRWVAREADRLIGRMATHLYADSLSQREFLIAEGLVPPGRISVIGGGSIAGVELQRFDRRAMAAEGARVRAQLGIDSSSCVIAFVGRVTRDKGIRELIAAFRTVSARGARVDLVLVGPEEHEQAPLPAEVAAEIASNPRIHAVGYSTEPERYLAAAEILCLPSYREGFGSVVIEAGAMELASVATRVTGLEDTIVDGETGLLVPAKDPGALAEALMRLIDDPGLRKRMGDAGRRRAIDQFDAHVINGHMVAEYKRLLGIG